MKEKIRTVRMMDYLVHIMISSETLMYFEAYPIQKWEKLSGEQGISYQSKENSMDTIDVFNENTCLKKFNGSFCWRGVWEGRIYFLKSEYWGEELSEMSELYNNHIVPYCKDFISKGNTLGYEDN